MASRPADANVSHPYYPLDLSLPHYKENALPFHVVVAVVVVVFAAVYLAGWIVVKRDRFGRLIRIEEKVKLSWFWLSGCIHLILEGYLTLTSGTIAGSNNILAQISMASNVSHPYYPRGMHLPHYRENTLSLQYILTVGLGAFAVIYALAWILLKRDRYGRTLAQGEKASLCWFGLCGFIHMILEGYLTLTSASIAGSDHILAQMWKEYAKGDSRYVSNDTCTIVMETITAWLEGPGCLLTVWAFTTRHPMRYVMQLAVSIGQTYGVLIYFITEYYDDFAHGPLFHPVYFWLYVIGFNAPWVILPPIFIRQSWQELNKAQRALDKANGFMPPSDSQGKSKKKK